MARSIVFEIITKASLGELKALQSTLEGISSTAKKMGRIEALGGLEDELKKIAKTSEKARSAMLDMSRVELDKSFGDQAKRASRDVENLSTRLKDLAADESRLNALRRKSKNLPEQMAEAEERLAEAKRKVALAQQRLNKVTSGPHTAQDLDRAQRSYLEAQAAMKTATVASDKLGKELQATGQEVSDIERRFTDLVRTVDQVRKTAGGKAIIEKALTGNDATRIQEMEQALKSFGSVATQTWQPVNRLFDGLSLGVKDAATDMKMMGNVTDRIKDMRKALVDSTKAATAEAAAHAKLDRSMVQRAIGSTPQAINASVSAYRQQNEQAIALRGNIDKLVNASHSWAAADTAARTALARGNAALEERQSVQSSYMAALRESKSVETALGNQREALMKQQRRLGEEQVEMLNRVNAAQSNLMTKSMGTAAYREAETQLNDLRQAYAKLDDAIDQNDANIRQNAAAMSQAATQTRMIQQDTTAWATTMSRLRASMTAVAPASMFGSMIAQMQNMNKLAMSLAATFAGRLRSSIAAVASASKSFVGSGASIFSGLQRALQSTGSMFTKFANNVTKSMKQSHAAMMELYAAGFALNMMGSQVQQFGMSGFRNMSQSLQNYMEYERLRNQAAIAGAESAEEYRKRTGQEAPAPYMVNTTIVDEIVRNLQRGVATPEWLTTGGKALPVAFDAKELAQGLYYYSSAIGQPITDQNKGAVGDVVSTIMQMAKVTNTGVETAMKGVLNVAMEYGYNPRDLSAEGSRNVANIAAQMGYLANISTMEVSDIVQMFKMVGPMVHELSGNQPGAGLNETFMLAYLASEVGLRGGNVGRGLNQAMTSMLDPTPEMLENFAKYFPDVSDAESFRNRFFDETTGTLKGGLTGFLEQLATIPINQQSQALAELFTTNATRALIGPLGDIANDPAAMSHFMEQGGISGFLERIGGESPFEWLAAAAAETADSVNGWFLFMQNGWFQFQAAIIGSVKGPLTGAFRGIGEMLFEIGERIQLNPAIGQTIATVVAAISSLAAVLGTVMIGAGAILLLGRSFALASGMFLPFIRVAAMAGVTLLALLPLFALIAVAVGLLAAAFQANVFGIADAWESLQYAFANFDTVVVPAIDDVLDKIGELGRAFNEFVNGILIGQGSTDTLFSVIQDFFGPLLGNTINAKLQQLREALTGTREAVADFFSVDTFDASALKGAGLAIQGFLEYLFLGMQRLETAQAQDAIGNAFGIENLSAKLRTAATELRGFIENVIGLVRQLGSVWVNIGQDIWSNLGRIFASGGLGNVFAAIGTIAQGVAKGIVTAFTTILSVVEMVTDKIADFAEGLRAAEANGQTFMGMAVSFQGILQAIGVAIGLYFGARLVMMFSPLASMLVSIIPMITGLASIIVGLGGRFVIMAAQVAISVAAFAAQAAVMLVVAAATLAYQAAQFALGIAMVVATGSAVGQSGAIVALSSAFAVLTGATIAGTTAMSAFGAVVTIILAVIGAFFVTLALIAASMFVVAGALIVLVGATQGIGAAFATAAQFAQGLWTGLQLGVGVIISLLGLMGKIASMVGAITGLGNAFQTMGLIAGLAISGIIVGVAALLVILGTIGAAMAVVAAAILLPIASFAALSLSLMGIKGPLDTLQGLFSQAFNLIADQAQLAGVKIGDALVNGLINGFNQMVDLAATFSGFGFFLEQAGYGLDSLIPNVDNSSTMAALLNLEGQVESFRNTKIEIGIESPDTKGFMDMLDSIGVGEYAREFLITIGIDPESFSLDDLNTENLTQLMEIPEVMKGMEDMDWSALGPSGTEYDKAMDNWNMWQDAVASMGEPRAREFFNMQGWEIPSAAPVITDYFATATDAVNAGGDGLVSATEAKMAEIQQAFEGLKGMSMEDYLGAIFDPLAGQGGKSIASWFAGQGSQTILDALGENAPWMNQMELMADVAGTGLDMGANVYGENMHKVLTPYLEILSQQTGVDISTMLANVPKFIAPEEFMGIAAGDLMMGISQLGPELFKQIDTLGMDLLDSTTGLPFEEFGLEWAELQAYAVGQAVANQDWNLADYLSESWGISVAEAESYLAANGIDPEVISDSWFEATEAAALTGNGAYSAMTQEMYDFLKAETSDFATDVISMTEEEWARIPPAYKAVMANMGITTIITDEFLPNEAIDAARGRIQEFSDMIQTLPTTLGKAGANYSMDGLVESFHAVARSADGTMVTLQDLDGTQVTIPAAEYEGFIRSLRIAQGYTEDFLNSAKRLQEQYFGTAGAPSGEYQRAVDMGQGSTYTAGFDSGAGGGMAARTPNQKYGVPEELKIKVEVDTTDAEADLKAVTTQITALGETSGEIPISMNFDTFSGDLMWIQSSLASLEGATGSVEIPISLNFDTFNGDLMWIQTSLSMLRSSTGSVEIPISLNFDTFNGDLVWIQTSLASLRSSTGSIEIPISLDFTTFNGDLMWIQTSLSTISSTAAEIRLSINRSDIDVFNQLLSEIQTASSSSNQITIMLVVQGMEGIDTLRQNLSYITTGSWPVTVTVEHTEAQNNINAVQSNLNDLVVGSYTVTVSASVATANNNIGTVQTKVNTLVGGSYIVMVGAVVAGALSAIESVLQKLRYLTAGSWNATVGVNDNASGTLNSINSLLNGISGRSVTATAHVNTIQTTTTQTIALGTIKAAATGGWRSGGQAVLVGEEGPEIVYFPDSGFVFTASETDSILNQRVQSAGSATASNVFASEGNVDKGGSSIIQHAGDVYNFNAPITIGTKEAATAFFDEVDRRTGKKTQLANRGMVSFDEKLW